MLQPLLLWATRSSCRARPGRNHWLRVRLPQGPECQQFRFPNTAKPNPTCTLHHYSLLRTISFYGSFCLHYLNMLQHARLPLWHLTPNTIASQHSPPQLLRFPAPERRGGKTEEKREQRRERGEEKGERREDRGEERGEKRERRGEGRGKGRQRRRERRGERMTPDLGFLIGVVRLSG